MGYYRLLEPIIRRYEAAARSKFGAVFSARVNDQFSDLQRNYYSRATNPSYSTNVKKFAYLYKYCVAHGHYVYHALWMARTALKPILALKGTFRVACIGGGPGSEILGIHQFITKAGLDDADLHIKIVNFDKEETWEPVAKEVLAALPHKAKITLRFQKIDATDPKSYNGVDFSKFDLVISSFFLSETRKLGISMAARAFWTTLIDCMKEGALFLVVDYADAQGGNWAYLSSILKPLEKHKDIVVEQSVVMSCPDPKDCLLDIETELDHRPKKNGENMVRLLKK